MILEHPAGPPHTPTPLERGVVRIFLARHTEYGPPLGAPLQGNIASGVLSLAPAKRAIQR